MNGAEFPLEDYLLQRDRMMLIDVIVDTDGEKATTRSVTTRQWPLYENGGINPIVIVELVAQTAGASIRFEEIRTRKDENNKGGGFIVGIKEAFFFMPAIPVDTTIITHSSKERVHLNYAEYSGFSTVDNTEAGRVTLQVLRTE